MYSSPAIIQLALLFAGSFAVALVLEPAVMRWATAFGVRDEPGWRKVHTRPKPSAGGLVFFLCLMISVMAVLEFWPVLWREQYWGLVGAALALTLAGVWDDVFGMRAALKLVCQFFAGGLLYAAGYRLDNLGIPFTGVVVELGPFDFVVTVLAVAAVVNAINMLDGLDGLAAGSVFIMCAFLAYNKISTGDPATAAVLIITMGATLAFLGFNFHPARVFMGDTGSMFLGVVLASELLDATSQGTAVTTLLLPLVILGIPIFDMLIIMLTRASSARHIFLADKSHLHHRLLGLGLSHREVVLVVYAMNVYMGLMAIIYKHVAVTYRGLYLFSLALFLFIVFYAIGMAHHTGARGAARPGDAHD
jgi:UDP-GlcNAc:undecaprenyl-phosphate GlcNAc-1-phosphate transferase